MKLWWKSNEIWKLSRQWILLDLSIISYNMNTAIGLKRFYFFRRIRRKNQIVTPKKAWNKLLLCKHDFFCFGYFLIVNDDYLTFTSYSLNHIKLNSSKLHMRWTWSFFFYFKDKSNKAHFHIFQENSTITYLIMLNYVTQGVTFRLNRL